MFIQCGVLWFCYVFTLFYVCRRRDLANILSQVGTSCHRGTQLRCRRGSRADQLPKVGSARGKGLRFQGVCTVRETTDVLCCLSRITNPCHLKAYSGMVHGDRKGNKQGGRPSLLARHMLGFCALLLSFVLQSDEEGGRACCSSSDMKYKCSVSFVSVFTSKYCSRKYSGKCNISKDLSPCNCLLSLAYSYPQLKTPSQNRETQNHGNMCEEL